jgi:hypothetical protein
MFAQVTDDYKKSLRTMLTAGGTEETFKVAIVQMFGMFKDQRKDVPEEVWKSLEKEFLQTSLNDIIEMLAPVYQKHFTKEDLDKLTDFYHTPVGKKFAEKTPLIMQESMQVGQQWGMKIGERVMTTLKEKGY